MEMAWNFILAQVYEPWEHLHVDETIIRSFRKSYFHVSYSLPMPGTLAWQRSSRGDAGQRGKIVTLSISLSLCADFK